MKTNMNMHPGSVYPQCFLAPSATQFNETVLTPVAVTRPCVVLLLFVFFRRCSHTGTRQVLVVVTPNLLSGTRASVRNNWY